MTDLLLKAENIHLDYPVYSANARSLRNTVLNLAVGGKIMRSGQGIVHVSALRHVSFELREGDRLGIIGHNGSGKTTLLNVLAGIYEPRHGQLTVRGVVSSMLDMTTGVDGEASGVENIRILGRLRGLSRHEIEAKIAEIVEASELGAYAHLPVKTYSAGMSARLFFVFATSFSPDILLLDEWLGAGDASFMEKAQARMQQLVGRSRGVILATHNIGLVQNFCNKLLVLHNGTVEYFGETSTYFAVPVARVGEHSLGSNTYVDAMAASGWYAGEDWGRWASQPEAVVKFRYEAGSAVDGVRLKVRVPTHPRLGEVTGRIGVNGEEVAQIAVRHPETRAEVVVEKSAFIPDDFNTIEVRTDEMIIPAAVDPTFHDPRQIGLGLYSIEFFAKDQQRGPVITRGSIGR